MSKKIAVIIGHPDGDSFCSALAAAYSSGASRQGAEVRTVDLGAIAFDPSLKHGFRKRTELEPDLVAAQETIRWADHLVFVYPTWWGTMPAILKGFIDRVFLPGFAFKHREGSSLWDKLLAGKTARLIVTMDSPLWYNRFVYGKPGHRAMKISTLHYCGIKPVKITEFGSVRTSKPSTRQKWLAKVEALGGKQA